MLQTPPNNLDNKSINSKKSSRDIFTNALATTHLIENKQSNIDFKDFSKEVRSIKDIEKYLSAENVILDENSNKLSEIFKNLLVKAGCLDLVKVQSAKGGNDQKKRDSTAGRRSTLRCENPIDEYLSQLFINHDSSDDSNDSFNEYILSKSIQAASQDPTGLLHFQQNWIVVPISSTSISESKISISRLSRPTNISERARTVRFVILVTVDLARREGVKSADEIARFHGWTNIGCF